MTRRDKKRLTKAEFDQALAELAELGLVVFHGDKIQLTESGKNVADLMRLRKMN